MNLVDIILLIPIAIGLVRGLIKGLLRELTGFASIILGLVSAFLLSEPLYNILKMHIDPGIGLRAFSFVIVFFLVAFIIYQIGRILTKIVNFMALGIVNYALGGVFGGLKVIAVLVVLIYFYTPYQDNQPLFQSDTIDNSIIYNRLKEYSPFVENILGEAAEASFSLDKLKIKGLEKNPANDTVPEN